MLNKEHIITINVKSPWFHEALEYALQSWTSTFNRMGKPNPYYRLEKIIIGIIAEKALEQHLINIGTEYETFGKTKWYEEDRYDIGINGYAIDVKANFLDLNSQYINNKMTGMFVDKFEWFLKCHALVPMDQFNPGSNKRRIHNRNKIYIFPFVEGHFEESKNKPPLVHALWDYVWLKKADKKDLPNLGKLSIKYSGKLNNSSIVLYGTSEPKNICIETIKLNSSEITSKNDYYQLFSIKWKGELPNGVLRISSKRHKLTETIKPVLSFNLTKVNDSFIPIENNWQSIAIHNFNVYLLGWIYEDDLRVIGKEYKRFTKTIEQYSELKVDNWGCLIEELNPMKDINNI